MIDAVWLASNWGENTCFLDSVALLLMATMRQKDVLAGFAVLNVGFFGFHSVCWDKRSWTGSKTAPNTLVFVTIMACSACRCGRYVQPVLLLPYSNVYHHHLRRDAILLCLLASFISVPRSVLVFLSHSYGGRDENGCLIMQRGQPIKGPRLSDLKAHSRHSWRDGTSPFGLDCCVV